MSTFGRPTPAPETEIIVAPPTFARSGVVASIIAGSVLAIFGLVLTGIGSGGPGFLRPIGVALLIVGALVAIIPILLRVEGIATRLTGWSNPTLEITPWPLHLGSPATVVYRRRPAKASTLNTLAGAPDVLAELVCQEWVQYTVGTSTHTETDEVVRLQASTPGRITADGVETVFQLTIPVDVGGPSLSLRNNRVSWWLETRLGEPFGRRTSTKVDLIVPPVLDRDAVIGEGGFNESELL